MIKGLELASKYYFEVCQPLIQSEFPQHYYFIAAGLVGEGSEAFGFDDELSQDHDFTPLCCYWLPDEHYNQIASKLESLLRSLSDRYLGYPISFEAMRNNKRRGVWKIGSFFEKYIGVKTAPETLYQWLNVPESSFALMTNGQVFYDELGEFSKIRNELLMYYPEDIRLLKIASCCMHIAQSGQYNFKRSMLRGDIVAARIAETQFITKAMHIVYALNKRYTPYFKWLRKGMETLPILGKTVSEQINKIVSLPAQYITEKEELIEKICSDIIAELKAQKLSYNPSDFLLVHGDEVRTQIRNATVKQIDPFAIT